MGLPLSFELQYFRLMVAQATAAQSLLQTLCGRPDYRIQRRPGRPDSLAGERVPLAGDARCWAGGGSGLALATGRAIDPSTGCRSHRSSEISSSGTPSFAAESIFALYLKTKNFPLAYVGSHFRDQHRLLDDQGAEIIVMTDPLAERVRALGACTIRSSGDIPLAATRGQRCGFRPLASNARRTARGQCNTRRQNARDARSQRRIWRRRHRQPSGELDRLGREAGFYSRRSATLN